MVLDNTLNVLHKPSRAFLLFSSVFFQQISAGSAHVFSPEETVIKATGSEGRDVRVHAILRVEHHLRVSRPLQPLEEALTVVGVLRFLRKNGGRQLRRIANHDHSPANESNIQDIKVQTNDGGGSEGEMSNDEGGGFQAPTDQKGQLFPVESHFQD